MRTRWLLVLVMMSACTTQGVDRARRWPAHRKEGDARFAELERRNAELERSNAELGARVAKLEAWVKGTKAPANAPPPPAPPPP